MHNAEAMREKLFTMRMSVEEAERLDFIAKHYGLNGSGVVRMLLKKEEAQIRYEEAVLKERAPHLLGEEYKASKVRSAKAILAKKGPKRHG